MEQKQRWPGWTRHIVAIETSEGHTASVQLELWDEPQNWGGHKGTAWICGLWVDEPLRRQGYAARLMDRAEQIAMENGHESVYLEWSIKESPTEIFQWYERSGYEEKAFSVGENANALMCKQLAKRESQSS